MARLVHQVIRDSKENLVKKDHLVLKEEADNKVLLVLRVPRVTR